MCFWDNLNIKMFVSVHIFWSQRELLAMGEELRVLVKICGSAVEQVSCLYALLAMRQTIPLDPSTSAPVAALSIQKVRLSNRRCFITGRK